MAVSAADGLSGLHAKALNRDREWEDPWNVSPCTQMLGTAQAIASMADFKGWTSNYYDMGTAYKSMQIHLLLDCLLKKSQFYIKKKTEKKGKIFWIYTVSVKHFYGGLEYNFAMWKDYFVRDLLMT